MTYLIILEADISQDQELGLGGRNAGEDLVLRSSRRSHLGIAGLGFCVNLVFEVECQGGFALEVTDVRWKKKGARRA
jgi:hypothetical protein